MNFQFEVVSENRCFFIVENDGSTNRYYLSDEEIDDLLGELMFTKKAMNAKLQARLTECNRAFYALFNDKIPNRLIQCVLCNKAFDTLLAHKDHVCTAANKMEA